MNAAPDIFLSYNREDAAIAKTFADAFARGAIEVQDDGRGMEISKPTSGQKHGHGLNNMSVRAAKLGAELVIESSAAGTCVRLIFARPSEENRA